MSRIKMLTVTVLATMILSATGVFVGSVQARTPLGGLDLDGFCQSLGFSGATLTGPQIGVNAACNPDRRCVNKNWQCIGDGKINMNDACQEQFNRSDVTAWPTDPHDAFSWVCYSIP